MGKSVVESLGMQITCTNLRSFYLDGHFLATAE